MNIKIIGNNLRSIRQKRGYSQAAIGELAGVTFQQIQKYEKGVNHMKAEMVFALSKALKVSVNDFFKGCK